MRLRDGQLARAWRGPRSRAVVRYLATGTALSTAPGGSYAPGGSTSAISMGAEGPVTDIPRFPEPFFVRPLDEHGYRRSVSVRSPTQGPSQWTDYVRTLGQTPTYADRVLTVTKDGDSGLSEYAKDRGEWSDGRTHFAVNLGPRMFPTMTAEQRTGYGAYQEGLRASDSATEKTGKTDIAWTGLDTGVEERVAQYRYWKDYQEYRRSMAAGSTGGYSTLSTAVRVRSRSAYDPNEPINPYDTRSRPELDPYTSRNASTGLSTQTQTTTAEVAPRKTQTAEEQATSEAMTDPKIQGELARREMAVEDFTAATLSAGTSYTMDDVRRRLREAVTILDETDATGTTQNLNDLRMGTASVNPYSATQTEFDTARKRIVLGLKSATVSMSATAADSDDSDEEFRAAHSTAAEKTREAATILEESIRWTSEGHRRPNDTVETITLTERDANAKTKNGRKEERASTMRGDGSETYLRWEQHQKAKLAAMSGKTGNSTPGVSNTAASGPPTSASNVASTSRGTTETLSTDNTGPESTQPDRTRMTESSWFPRSAASDASAVGHEEATITSQDPFSDFNWSHETTETTRSSGQPTASTARSTSSAGPTESTRPSTDTTNRTGKRPGPRFADDDSTIP